MYKLRPKTPALTVRQFLTLRLLRLTLMRSTIKLRSNTQAGAGLKRKSLATCCAKSI